MKTKICGIYKFTNPVNGLSYIGQSINIMSRYQEHRRNCLNPNYINYNTHFYNALRKYGFNNFTFQILEECSPNKLDEREVYWINEYDSFNNGYNMTPGGDFNPSKVPEIVKLRTQKLLNDPEINKKLASRGRAKITKDDVRKIRTLYKEGKTFSEVYELYEDKISYSAFQNCWRGKSWSDIMPEVYQIREVENTGGSKFNSNSIKELRIDYMNGVSKKELSRKYSLSAEALRRILKLERWTRESSIPDGYEEFILSK